MADGCNNLIEDFLCFVLKQIYACTMSALVRPPHEGRIYFHHHYHCVSSATTVQPFVVRLFLLISLTRSSKHWGLPRPTITPAIWLSHHLSCCLSRIVFTGGWETGPSPHLFLHHRRFFAAGQVWPGLSVFVRTVITISVRHVQQE